MAEYNNPLSGFLGGFSAPLIAREKEDRLLKNQLGLIGLQNDLATQTATATREFETINQTILSYSNRRDKLTEERNKMIRSAYAPPGSNNLMPLSPAQSNARIREMGFEPGYFKQIVQQMDDQISKLGEGIDQMMIYKTNKYGPSGVTFKHISSIGRLPPPGGAGGGTALGAGLTGQEVTPTTLPGAPPQGDPNFWSNMAKIGVDAGSAIGTTASNAVQAIAEANKKVGSEVRIDPDQRFDGEGPGDRWGMTLPGSGAIVEGGVQVIPPLVHKAIVSLKVGIDSEDNTVNKVYEKFSRMLGIDPTQTADFWFGGGSSLGKIKAAGKEIPKDFSRLIDWVDGLLIQNGFVPPGYQKNDDGQIVLIPGSVRDLMQKEAAAEETPDTSSVDALKGIYQENPITMDLATPPPPVEGTIPMYDPLRTDPYNDEPIYDIPSATTALEQTNRQNEYMRQQIAALERKRAEQMIQVAENDKRNREIAAQIAPATSTAPVAPSDAGLSREALDAIIRERTSPSAAFDTFSGIETAGDEAAQYRAEQDQQAAIRDQAAVLAEQQEAAIIDTSEEEGLDWLKKAYEMEGGDAARIGTGALGLAAIAYGDRIRKMGNLTLEGSGGGTISGGASRKALKKTKAKVKGLENDLKKAKKLLERMKGDPAKFGNPGKQAARVNDLTRELTTEKQKFNSLSRDRMTRFKGKTTMAIGAFTVALSAGIEKAFGAEKAADLEYQMLSGNQEAINLALGFAEIVETIALPATMLFDNPPPRSSLERMSGPEMEVAPDISGGGVRNYQTRFNRNAYDASLADALASDNVDTFNQVSSPRTSIRRRQFRPDDGMGLNPARTTGSFPAMNLRSESKESPSTFDDFVNWLSSIGGSVIPEAEAADVPIESIGLAREVPEMVLNNPRVGIGPKISATESNGLYDAVGYNTVTDEARPPDPMVNTSKWADVRAKYGDTLGIGKYQFTNDFLVDIYADTLNKSKKDAQIFLDNQVFKESVQEQALALAFGYLGLEDVIRGKMSAKSFVDKIAGRWHGIAKAIEEDPNYKQVMIDDLEGMVEQATGRTFTLSNRE